MRRTFRLRSWLRAILNRAASGWAVRRRATCAAFGAIALIGLGAVPASARPSRPFHRIVGAADSVTAPSFEAVAPVADRWVAGRLGELGLGSASDALERIRVRRDALGWTHVAYAQRHRGLEVFGSQLRLHFDPERRLRRVNGLVVPGLDVAPEAIVSEAGAIALAAGGAAPGARSPRARLGALRRGIGGGPAGGDRLVWRVELARPGEIVWIDAADGSTLGSHRRSRGALYREVYEGGIANNLREWEEGDALPYAGPSAYDDSINRLIATSEDVYDLLATVSGGSFLSWDGADAPMLSVWNDLDADCPSWDGQAVQLCPGSDADDTIAHEWGHAWGESTQALFPQWQPGAVQEAYADIFAEAVDLLNGEGSDDTGSRTNGRCSKYVTGENPDDETYRWLVGEDDGDGAYRDLWNPECFGDPGRVGAEEYWCFAADDGGVHENSNVPAHAFALLVDGGTYNSTSVSGIGLTRALAIWWRAQTVYHVPTTDFADHADALEAACADLVAAGTNLPTPDTDSPSPTPSGQTMSAGDCDALADAIAAVELRTPPDCGFEPLLDPSPAPPFCSQGGAASTLLAQDFEAGLGAWTAGRRDVVKPGSFDTADWAAVGGLPAGRAGSAAFVADDPSLGDCIQDVEAGVLYLQSPAVVVPAASRLEFRFDHWVATERGLDGGNLKVSVNAGAWALVPASAFLFNPYNDDLDPPETGSDDPMAGEPAYTGSDEGANEGSWGTSLVALSSLASPGDSVRLRFELGLDGCGGLIGWYVDDVAVEACGNCGNALLDGSETCDDGDFAGGDGCSPACQVESGWSCSAPVPPIPDTNRVADGSFEAGTPNPSWAEASDNFGTPLVPGSFGIDPSDGDWLAWFGGSDSSPETASLEQVVTLPADADELRFDLQIGACDSAGDVLRVLVDGSQEFDTGSCSESAGYVEQVIDLSAFADGGAHTLRFECETSATNGTPSNFFVDRVGILDPGVPGVPSVCQSLLVFADDFDDGDACSWSARVGGSGCP